MKKNCVITFSAEKNIIEKSSSLNKSTFDTNMTENLPMDNFLLKLMLCSSEFFIFSLY